MKKIKPRVIQALIKEAILIRKFHQQMMAATTMKERDVASVRKAIEVGVLIHTAGAFVTAPPKRRKRHVR